MACHHLSNYVIHLFSRSLSFHGRNFLMIQRAGNLCNLVRLRPYGTRPRAICFNKDSCKLSGSLDSDLFGVPFRKYSTKQGISTETEGTNCENTFSDSVKTVEKSSNLDSSNGRVMLIDGTSVIYRAYFRLLAKLHHGHLSNADGNGDWVLTISTALSLIIDVLEFTPSHVAVVFDHDGIPFGNTSVSSKQSFVGKVLFQIYFPSSPANYIGTYGVPSGMLSISDILKQQGGGGGVKLCPMILLSSESPHFLSVTLVNALFIVVGEPTQHRKMAKGRLLSDLGGGRGTEGLTLFSEGCGVAVDDGGLGISLSGWLLSKAMEVAWSSPDFGWCRHAASGGIYGEVGWHQCLAAGLNFRHTLYPSYKSHRPPTPDTIVQGLQYFKASIKAMSIKVIEVPGVEADDVIGTLAARSVNAGFKVRVVSPDKDFFQILSPSLRLLRIAPRGSGLVSFGMEDFAKKYGSLQPSQFVDVMSLMGDESDNIPGIEGIGIVHAVKLITKFGSLEKLLDQVDQVEEERFRKALISNAHQAILSKNLAMLRSDLPYYMVPFATEDLRFTKPEDNGEKFTSLLTAISAYAEGFSADSLIRRAIYLWKKLETT
ncbi:hypothetical protein RHMOL_Rhmol02G0092500 [Rhododendron molle]|uniref:Uncharacterized protein n=1 Tax=Rhododendron molle TaxID=49168 RepID=A0ACC0PPR4_RHOML|nr:hypothetical protein RHMOL_Rhmol02G0092500 [Rhododendron molle]